MFAFPTPLERLALIGLLDAIDKTDTLFHEIRQLQTTLIQQIGIPELYGPLRHEERYLWGDWLKPAPEQAGQRQPEPQPSPSAAPSVHAPGFWQRLRQVFRPVEPLPPNKATRPPVSPTPPNDCLDNPPSTSWASRIESIPHSEVRTVSRRLAKIWVVRYALPSGPFLPDGDVSAAKADASDEDHDAARRAEQLFEQAHKAMSRAAEGGYLTVNILRCHAMLSELQVVKQNLLREKILLVHAGLAAFQPAHAKRTGHDERQPPRIPPALGKPAEPVEWDHKLDGAAARRIQDFLLARFAVNTQLRLRVARVGDIQRQLEQLLDVSLDQDPRPSAARRRDQGMYVTAMLHRTRALQKTIRELLGNGDGLGVLDPLNGDTQPQIMHRWDQRSESRISTSIDAIYAKDLWNTHPILLDNKGRYQEARYISSSYWMPDRPDLQAQIAHEIVHAELLGRYYGFSLHFLAGSDDPFARMINALREAVDAYTSAADEEQAGPWILGEDQLKVALEEIAADTMAAAIVGPSYVFQVFNELMGYGFEYLIEGAPETPDFDLDLPRDMFERLEERAVAPLWYLRMRAVLAITEAMVTAGRPPAPLLGVLLQGASNAVELFYSAFWERAPEAARPRWALWKHLGDTVADIVRDREGRDFAKRVRPYGEAERREERLERACRDTEEARAPLSIREPPPDGKRMARRLSKALGDALLGPLLDRVCEDPRLLALKREAAAPASRGAKERERDPLAAKASAGLQREFRKLYVDGPAKANLSARYRNLVYGWAGYRLGLRRDATPRLFRSVHDIPWQWALATTLDLLARPMHPTVVKTLASAGADGWLRAVQRLNWLGRDVFQLGLELEAWLQRDWRDILETLVRAVGGLHERLDADASGAASVDMAPGKPHKDMDAPQKLEKQLEPLKQELETWLIDERGATNILKSFIGGWSEPTYGPEWDASAGKGGRRPSVLTIRLVYKLTCILKRLIPILAPQNNSSPQPEYRSAQRLLIYAETALSLHTEKSQIVTIVEYMGHRPKAPEGVTTLPPVGLGRVHRIERMASHAPLMFPNKDQGRKPNGLFGLHPSPWVDRVDSRAWPSLATDPPFNMASNLPLLGRYDHMRIESARTVAPSSLPFLSVRERHTHDHPQALTHSAADTTLDRQPFFVRQQFGLPFRRKWWLAHTVGDASEAARRQSAWHHQREWFDLVRALKPNAPADGAQADLAFATEWFIPDGEPPAIAVISVELAQRSARLSLVQEICGSVDNASPWRAFRQGQDASERTSSIQHGDFGYLIDGWGDLLFVFHLDHAEMAGTCPSDSLPRPEEFGSPTPDMSILNARLDKFHGRVSDRMTKVTAFHHALADHFLVARAELTWTTLAADVALRAMTTSEPEHPFHWSAQFRLRPDRGARSMHHRFREGILAQAAKLTEGSDRRLRLVRQAGSTDYRISVVSGEGQRNLLEANVFGSNGLVAERYRALGCMLAQSEMKTPPAGHVFIPAHAILLSELIGRNAAPMIDNVFTMVGELLSPQTFAGAPKGG